MTNGEIREIVFNKIKEFGFKVYDVKNIDGYFIFESDKDGVTHFRVKGKGMWKHWKFGLWIDSNVMDELTIEEYKGCDNAPKVIQLFAQHDTWIDKFKPSRSDLLFTLDGEQFDKYINENDKNIHGESYTFNRLKDMLMMMVRHPFMCYNNYCGNYCGYTSESFILEYIKCESKDKYKYIQKKLKVAFWLPYTKCKIALCKHNKCIHNIELYDFEKENNGWSTDYLYQVRIKFTDNVTDEDIVNWLNVWWRKEEYGKFGYYNHVIKLDRFRQVGNDNPFTFTYND